MIVAGDIGGTKTVLALFEPEGDELRLVRDATYPSRDHPTFEEILAKFLAEKDDHSHVDAGCFGVAGAVMDGRVTTTNLPWTLDEENLAEAIAAPKATLLNDLEASAYAMPFLPLDQLHVLNPGTSRRTRGNIAVIAAGTGLGEAVLFWDGQKYQPIASEGGHGDFAPQSDVEIDLLRYLRTKFHGHVSYERVLSGPGFYNVYSFFRDSGHAPEPAWLAEKIRAGDPSAVVSEVGPGRTGHQLRGYPRPLRHDLRRRGRQPRAQGPGRRRRLRRRRDRPQDPPRPGQGGRLPQRVLRQGAVHRPDEEPPRRHRPQPPSPPPRRGALRERAPRRPDRSPRFAG